MNVNCAHHRIADIASLTLNPKNANKHPENQIKLLAKILKFQGWRHPVVVSKRSGFVVAGHGRIEAAKLNGWESVPVDDQEFENEAAEYAFLISDNTIAELAETDLAMVNELALELPKDFDLELLGIPDFEIIETEVLEPQCDEDAVGELPAEPKTKLGDIYQLGRHRLMCGDSTSIDAVERLLGGAKKVDMIFTDPPYGMNLDTDFESMHSSNQAGSRTDRPVIGDQETYDPNPIFAIEADEVFIWGADYFCQSIPEGGSWIVWDKRESENMDKVHGACFELCWSKRRHKKLIYRKLWSGFQGMTKADGRRVHPTQKPVELVTWFLEQWGKQTKTVLDLYGGSGSTIIGAEKSDKDARLMEIDPHYCDVIVNRWEKYTGKKAELING